jgi:hypothetical protein
MAFSRLFSLEGDQQSDLQPEGPASKISDSRWLADSIRRADFVLGAFWEK